MILRGETSSTHKYVRQYVNKTLVLQDKLPAELGRMYNRLMDDRSDADYDPTTTFSLDEVKVMAASVQSFMAFLEQQILTEKANLS